MRYKVETEVTRVEEFVQYIEAATQAEAEEQAERNREEGFLEAENFETIGVKVEAEQLDPNAPHAIVHGSSYEDTFNRQICLVCNRPLRWTGLNYDDPRNTTGKTIPGPWVHADEVEAEV